MSELEEETAGHARARMARRVRRFAIEVAFSLAFIALVFVAENAVEAGGGGKGGAAPVAAIIAAAGVLAAWTYVYVRWHLSHDEFARTLELQSVALGAGLTILAATVLGLFELVLGGPRVPIVFIAPAFSAFYIAVRILISRAYR